MTLFLQMLEILCAIVVLSEALNKLERADLFNGRPGLVPRAIGLLMLLQPWRWTRAVVIHVLKVVGWAFMSIGAAGHLAGPLMRHHPQDLAGTAVIVGFALLIVRSRFKEG